MNGTDPLDATSVHPESYEVTRKLMAKLGYSADDLRGGIPDITKNVKNTAALAEELSVGDIVEVKVLEVDPEKKRIALTMKGI